MSVSEGSKEDEHTAAGLTREELAGRRDHVEADWPSLWEKQLARPPEGARPPLV